MSYLVLYLASLTASRLTPTCICASSLTASRLTPTCGPGEDYFESIHECIPLSIAELPLFSKSVQRTKQCEGGVIDTIARLERLRFCDEVVGGLTIEVSDKDADYTALSDIASIQGC